MNEVLGTYEELPCYIRFAHYIRVKKTKKYKELGTSKNVPCYTEGCLL